MHVFNFHEKSAKKFCFVCGTDFPDSFELEEHLLEHTLEEPEKGKDIDDSDFISHVCKVCSVEVEGNLSDLMNHYHTTHDQFICTTCYECFADMTAYQDHKLSHMADSSESSEPVVFTCPVSDCFQMCEDKEALRDHISWHEDQDMGEEEITTLACTQCSGEFRNKMSLHRHLAEVHSVPNIKPFICELCNEEFSQSLDLHRHNTLNHAGIKRYGCAYCSQRFAFRSSYRRHVASQHDVAATILRI
nr:hypothetical protein BaRGS_007329 [Batillaria attramentaria]